MTGNVIKYLASVVAWLESAPQFNPSNYGKFYVNRVEVSFDGEKIGHFGAEDSYWIYTDTEGSE